MSRVPAPDDLAVVIPVKDGERTIGDAVRAATRQSRSPSEVVVVDNGSRDGTADAARRAGARVIEETTPGSYAARNAGIAATQAPIIAFTDADCTPDPDWLLHVATAFEGDSQIDVVGGPVVAPRVRTAAERWAHARGVLDQERAFTDAPFLPFFATANAAWRRDALARIGGFDAQLLSGGDVDACWRLQRDGGRLHFAPGAVVRHHHRESVGELLAQQRRYAVGHGRLDGRWSTDPEYARTVGTAFARMRAVWLTPVRVPWRALTGADVALPLVDTAVRIVHESGRRRGRRLAPLEPVSPQPVAAPVPD